MALAPPSLIREEAGGPSPLDAPGEELGVYIHWPFCQSKCPYCDFNSHVRERIDEARFASALAADLAHYAALTPGRAVQSVFLGGGTPSLMAPATVDLLLEQVRICWSVAADAEITLEANPGTLDAGRFAGFRDAGVNRLSIGVQALDDSALAFLGRGHSAREARAAVETAARLFPRWTFDLIYARPGQTPAAWRTELADALAIAGDHLSVYQLTIEPGTAFHTAHRLGEFEMPDDDLAGALFETTQEQLDAAGLPAYEISNHARPGAQSRHNLVYWRYGDYVGAGPGAHGRLTLGGQKFATRQRRAPEAWLARVEARGHGGEEPEPIAPAERGAEALMMGLRLAEGVDRACFRRLTGLDVFDAADREAADRLAAAGVLVIDEARIGATRAGRQRLNAILSSLLA